MSGKIIVVSVNWVTPPLSEETRKFKGIETISVKIEMYNVAQFGEKLNWDEVN